MKIIKIGNDYVIGSCTRDLLSHFHVVGESEQTEDMECVAKINKYLTAKNQELKQENEELKNEIEILRIYNGYLKGDINMLIGVK